MLALADDAPKFPFKKFALGIGQKFQYFGFWTILHIFNFLKVRGSEAVSPIAYIGVCSNICDGIMEM